MAHIIEAHGKQYTVGIGDTQKELCEIIEENMVTEFSKEVQRYIDYIKRINSTSNKDKINKALNLVIEACESLYEIDPVLELDIEDIPENGKKLIKAIELLWEVYDEWSE
jgi:hypothetical protein